MGISLRTFIEQKDFDNPNIVLELLASTTASATFFGKKIIILKNYSGNFQLSALAKKILQAIFKFHNAKNFQERNIALWNQALGRIRILDEKSTEFATKNCCLSCFFTIRNPANEGALPVHSLTLAKNCLITPKKEILYIYCRPLAHGSTEKVTSFLNGPLMEYCNN